MPADSLKTLTGFEHDCKLWGKKKQKKQLGKYSTRRCVNCCFAVQSGGDFMPVATETLIKLSEGGQWGDRYGSCSSWRCEKEAKWWTSSASQQAQNSFFRRCAMLQWLILAAHSSTTWLPEENFLHGGHRSAVAGDAQLVPVHLQLCKQQLKPDGGKGEKKIQVADEGGGLQSQEEK